MPTLASLVAQGMDIVITTFGDASGVEVGIMISIGFHSHIPSNIHVVLFYFVLVMTLNFSADWCDWCSYPWLLHWHWDNLAIAPHNSDVTMTATASHRRLDCLLNLLFKRRSKKLPKLRVTGLCEGNSPVTGEFPAQRASNAENVSIWWRHHERLLPCWRCSHIEAKTKWPIFLQTTFSKHFLSCSQPSN